MFLALNAPQRIEHVDDPRIADFRFVRERDLAGRLDAFVAEGEVVLDRLARSTLYRTRSVLIAENRLEKLQPVLDRFGGKVPIHVAARGVMDQIAGFPIHRGVLALGERGPALDPGDLLGGLGHTATVVGLVGVSNHDNVGGVFRNAAAFGAGAVLIDPATCDPLYRKAIRVSVGGALLVPFARSPGWPALLDALEQSGFEILALSPSGNLEIADVRRAARTALLVGAEGPGLPPALLSRVKTARIDMAGGFDSLNLATASGIALHRLTVA